MQRGVVGSNLEAFNDTLNPFRFISQCGTFSILCSFPLSPLDCKFSLSMRRHRLGIFANVRNFAAELHSSNALLLPYSLFLRSE